MKIKENRMDVKRITINCLEIEDKPGSLLKLLGTFASANVDLLCGAAFSIGTGKARVYLSAKDQKAFSACADKAKIKSTIAAGFVMCCEDRVGAGADALKDLAEAGINAIAGIATVFNGQCQLVVVVNAADGDTAEKALSN
jgi:hypothetical protein